MISNRIAERASKNKRLKSTKQQEKKTNKHSNKTHTVSKTQYNRRPNPKIPSVFKPVEKTAVGSLSPSPPWRAAELEVTR